MTMILQVRKRPGTPPGKRRYDLKKYCNKCGEYIELTEVHKGKNDYQYHNYCGQRIRTKPRLGKMKEKYWEGKRI